MIIILLAAYLIFPFSLHSSVKIHQQLLQVPMGGDQWKTGHRRQPVAQCWIGICASLILFSLLLGVKGTCSTYKRIKKKKKKKDEPSITMLHSVCHLKSRDNVKFCHIDYAHTHKNQRQMVNLWHRSLFWMAHRVIWDSAGKFYDLKIHLCKTNVSSLFWIQWNHLNLENTGSPCPSEATYCQLVDWYHLSVR